MTEDQVVTTGVDVTALSGLELRRTVARALGWKSWLQQRGGYTHVSWQKPGEREPWFRVQSAYVEKERASYSEEPVTVIDPKKHVDYDALPHFESSLDACFAPGGPVEQLREDGWGLKLGSAVHGRWYTTLTRSRDGTHRHVGDSGDRPAEAVCRAFLTAVSERGQ